MSPVPILRMVLTGFMGAGKSTVGALLAAQLGWRFIDVDEVLVEAEGRSIAAIFEHSGEAWFRRIEERAIAGLLGLERVVLALGGGAIESEPTRSRLFTSRSTHVVFLEAPLAVSLARCAAQTGGAERPVLRGVDPHMDTDTEDGQKSDGPQDALAERFARRLEHYRRAHRTLDTTQFDPQQLARLLLSSIEPAPKTERRITRK